MKEDDLNSEVLLSTYSETTHQIKRICVLTAAISSKLAWYIQMTKRLTISTETRTGVGGDEILEVAKKLQELQISVEKIAERSKRLKMNINAANSN